jgi:hypothetical protein
MKLLIGILVVFVVYIFAYFFARDSKHISQNSDFYTDRHFNIKHRPLLDKLIANGSSEKEAYEIIIANQDTELLNKRRLVIFWFILTLLCGSGLLSGIL